MGAAGACRSRYRLPTYRHLRRGWLEVLRDSYSGEGVWCRGPESDRRHHDFQFLYRFSNSGRSWHTLTKDQVDYHLLLIGLVPAHHDFLIKVFVRGGLHMIPRRPSVAKTRWPPARPGCLVPFPNFRRSAYAATTKVERIVGKRL